MTHTTRVCAARVSLTIPLRENCAQAVGADVKASCHVELDFAVGQDVLPEQGGQAARSCSVSMLAHWSSARTSCRSRVLT